MKVTVERPSESEALLNVELDWAELEKASDKAYRRLAQRYTVPGFRPGKAPRTMLERMVGKEAIYQEGLEDLIETTYREAVRQNDLTPLGQPEVDAPQIELGQPYTFTARVPVLAPVHLGEYHTIRVERPSTDVTDADVDKVVEQIRENQAMWLPVERPARIGDKVVVDLKLTVGDRTVSDLHDNEFELAEERAGIFTGMDQHLIGMTEGESKQFTTTIPEDYANAELAGKDAQYDVTLKGVKEHQLPDVDDELAKAAGEFQTLGEMREAVTAQLRSQKENDARRGVRDEAVKAAINQSQVEVHPVLVDEEVHAMMDEMNRMLSQSRISLEQYLTMTGKSEEEYHKELEPEAAERVKRDLVLDAIADAEGITADDDDIEGWLQLYNAMGGRRMRLRDLKEAQRANITRRIKRDKALSQLVEIATEGQAEGGAGETNTEANARAAATAATTTTSGNGEAPATADEQSIPTTQAAVVESDAETAATAPDEAAMTEPRATPAPAETDV